MMKRTTRSLARKRSSDGGSVRKTARRSSTPTSIATHSAPANVLQQVEEFDATLRLVGLAHEPGSPAVWLLDVVGSNGIDFSCLCPLRA
jgi:hypothetical protein